jgi:hypothetical protein
VEFELQLLVQLDQVEGVEVEVGERPGEVAGSRRWITLAQFGDDDVRDTALDFVDGLLLSRD